MTEIKPSKDIRALLDTMVIGKNCTYDEYVDLAESYHVAVIAETIDAEVLAQLLEETK